MSGEAKRRVIRVLWVNSAIAAARDQLRRLGDGDRSARTSAQNLINTLELRRERATETLGATYVRR
jgi:hypothetical protein